MWCEGFDRPRHVRGPSPNAWCLAKTSGARATDGLPHTLAAILNNFLSFFSFVVVVEVVVVVVVNYFHY